MTAASRLAHVIKQTRSKADSGTLRKGSDNAPVKQEPAGLDAVIDLTMRPNSPIRVGAAFKGAVIDLTLD